MLSVFRGCAALDGLEKPGYALGVGLVHAGGNLGYGFRGCHQLLCKIVHPEVGYGAIDAQSGGLLEPLLQQTPGHWDMFEDIGDLQFTMLDKRNRMLGEFMICMATFGNSAEMISLKN